MALEFHPINVDAHFAFCMAFRRDAYICTFHADHGFSAFIAGYEARMRSRLVDPRWYYIHIWDDHRIIGQLEFKSFSDEPATGYVHLMYIIPDYRGSGVADAAQRYIETRLQADGCQAALLTVGRKNERARRHYRRWGWQLVGSDHTLRGTEIFRRLLPVLKESHPA
ncbi:GNAT family N-acetyltransferase [Photobacterium sp. 53610]|uniref:GNAT family N-acetyltransferase n=1 Tax=Photobacterium sp. 53610 TaxID=3102789 RepID=UPI002EDB39B1